uniref:Lipoprotein n=1 Tax=viral metagenome TaxID=1070528 RepID=A0A6M3Y452_9ZZZZ
MKKYLLIFCIGLFIISGCVKVEQKVDYDSRTDCVYTVGTYLWLFDGFLWSNVHLEKAFKECNVKKSDIEIIKAKQMTAMLPYKQKLEDALKSDCQ